MPALKCPNPTCPFLFDPSQVPPGAVLTCPRCGMRFTLGPAAAPPPASDLPAFDPDPPAAGRKRPKSERGSSPAWLRYAAVLAAGGALVALVVTLANRGGGTGTPTGTDVVFRDVFLTFKLPADGWERDNAVQQEVKASLLGLRRTDTPDVKAALHAADYKTRTPQPAELRAAVRERLANLFDDLDPREPETGEWLGKPADVTRFRGNGKGNAGTLAGEAFIVADRGFAYVFVGWAPEAAADAALAGFADLRQRTTLTGTRTDWKEPTVVGKVIRGNGYALTDADGWWAAVPGDDPKAHADDPAADLALAAAFPVKDRPDARPRAELVAYILDPADDPLDAVRKHVNARYARLYELPVWSDLTDPPQGDPPPSGEVPPTAAPARFKAEAKGEGGSPPRLVVLSAIAATVGGKPRVVGVEASCAWADRGRWERRLAQLAGSLRAGGS